MKRITSTALSVFVFGMAFADATINNVIVRQQWPWSPKVNIDYVLSGDPGSVQDVDVVLKDGTETISPKVGSLSGDLYGVTPGAHRVIWDPTVGQQLEDAKVLTGFTATVSKNDGDGTFMIIDVSTTVDGKFPISFANEVPAGGWNQDEYKTGKIVLRRIPAGTYMMGSPTDELGCNQNKELQHQTTISQAFYVGIFEMTQKQYENITGANPSASGSVGDKLPVNNVSYDDLRGMGAAVYNSVTDDWPNYHEGGFFDGFNKKIALPITLDGYVFDLPSAAQWEYACRAGTTGAWNDGTTITNTTKDAQLDRIAWNRQNSSLKVQAVGTKNVPNAFGLYDMHGNVAEYVIDYPNGGGGAQWFNGTPQTDPILYAPKNWPYTIAKGGSVETTPGDVRVAAFNTAGVVTAKTYSRGFRLALYHR